jgi:hypothetical protein
MTLLPFDLLCDTLSHNLARDDQVRLLDGEVARLIQLGYGHGALLQAARASNRAYKTLAERARVVGYWQGISAAQRLSPGESAARDLLDEFPALTWTHLRVAKGYSKDPDTALPVLLAALTEGPAGLMGPDQFAYYVGKKKKEAGHVQKRYVIDNQRGLRVTIDVGAKEEIEL